MGSMKSDMLNILFVFSFEQTELLSFLLELVFAKYSPILFTVDKDVCTLSTPKLICFNTAYSVSFL